jgi:hypothetical protein
LEASLVKYHGILWISLSLLRVSLRRRWVIWPRRWDVARLMVEVGVARMAGGNTSRTTNRGLARERG